MRGGPKAEVESDKWTGFNLRPINILVLSSRARSLSYPCVCLFVVPDCLSLFLAHSLPVSSTSYVSSAVGTVPGPVFFYHSMTRKRQREYRNKQSGDVALT